MKFTHFPPIIVFILGASLLGAGYQWGHQTAPAATSTATGDALTLSSASSANRRNFGLFWEAWDTVHQQFFGTVLDTKLEEGAITGMVGALGDPYTVYLDPEAAKELGDGLQGVLFGIGAEIGVKNKKLVIVAPLPESPAAQAGLKPQDEILKIDGQTVGDLTFIEAVRRIRGMEGTAVVLTIAREDLDEPKDVSVTRAKIQVTSVTHELRPDGIGFIKISAFHEDTTTAAQAALEKFVTANVSGVILDLRGNPGGLLDQGIGVTSLFLPSGTVVKQKNKDGTVKTFSVDRTAPLPTTPLVVLVDGGSASAAEIVAGALQDQKRGTLVGERTFGKGSVQELEDLTNGGQLKITIAQWLTPNDRLINGTGIDPDVVVAKTEADDTANKDPQLARALEILKPKL